MVDYNTTQQHTREHIGATLDITQGHCTLLYCNVRLQAMRCAFVMRDTSMDMTNEREQTSPDALWDNTGALEHYADGECFGFPDHSPHAFNMASRRAFAPTRVANKFFPWAFYDVQCVQRDPGYAAVMLHTFAMRDTRDAIDASPAHAPSTDEREGRTRDAHATPATDVVRVALSLMDEVQHAADDDAMDYAGDAPRVVPVRERWRIAYGWARDAMRDARERDERAAGWDSTP